MVLIILCVIHFAFLSFTYAASNHGTSVSEGRFGECSWGGGWTELHWTTWTTGLIERTRIRRPRARASVTTVYDVFFPFRIIIRSKSTIQYDCPP